MLSTGPLAHAQRVAHSPFLRLIQAFGCPVFSGIGADDPKPRPALRPVCLRPARAQAAAVRCAAGRPSARHHRQAERVVQAIVPVASVPGLAAWTLCARTTPGRKTPARVAPERVFGDCPIEAFAHSTASLDSISRPVRRYPEPRRAHSPHGGGSARIRSGSRLSRPAAP